MSCHIFYVSHLPSSWRCHLIIFLADSTKFSLVPGGREICCRGGVKKIWNQVQRQTQIGLVQITTCEQLKKKKTKNMRGVGWKLGMEAWGILCLYAYVCQFRNTFCQIWLKCSPGLCFILLKRKNYISNLCKKLASPEENIKSDVSAKKVGFW